MPTQTLAAIDDWRFLYGRWRVHHRRLVARLAGSEEWQEFEGTSEMWPLLGGAGNVDDNVIELPGDPYRAASLRSLNPETGQWSIWWLDGRRPGVLDVPVVGSFTDGVGSFLAEDTFDGRPIVIRFLWTRIDTDTPRWEQAFSPDGGDTWETNWEMDFSRDPGG
ncbi:MAG: DUF1579 domain-containing protein [Deltaproteobacteria bacterium]|nr:MAG: DUF1579 domain-containing protein [Deltaproteobacteria bacterium]